MNNVSSDLMNGGGNGACNFFFFFFFASIESSVCFGKGAKKWVFSESIAGNGQAWRHWHRVLTTPY